MVKFLKLISLIFIVAAVLVYSLYKIEYSGFYGNNEAEAFANIAYDVKDIPSALKPKIDPPKLPNINAYTMQAIEDAVPELEEGYVLISPLEEGFRKLRSQSDIYGDMQGRLDPLSIVVAAGVYDLKSLTSKVDDAELIEKKEDGSFILHVPLNIRAEGTLNITDKQTLYLNAETGALLSSFGNLNIVDSNIYAWNVSEDTPAFYVDPETFRPYITGWCGSKINIAGSNISHIGFQASKSYGVSFTSCSDTLYRHDYAHLPGGTGWIIGNEFYDVYFGFYSYEAEDVVILRNEYRDNIVYGIDPHDRSKNLIIAYNKTHGTKQKHGIIVSRDVNNSFIFNNLSENNVGSGIMIDRNSHDNIVAYNVARNNGGDGLTYYESPDNLSYKNMLTSNKSAGLRIRNSWNVTSVEDVINQNEQMGVRLYATYLSKTHQAKYRDLDLDPYIQRASLRMVSPEMIGNVAANFKLTDFNSFEIFSPNFYKTPSKLFSGDLTGTSKSSIIRETDDIAGVRFIKKEAGAANAE